MMKKFNKIKLLSLLLCAVMLFASCGTTDGEPVVDNNGTAAPAPEAPAIDAAGVVAGVTQNLGYIGKHNNSSLSVNSILYDETAHESLYGSYGDFAVILKRTIANNYETGMPEYVTDTYTVKNVNNGISVWSSTPISYFYMTVPQTTYEFNMYCGTVLEITKSEAIVSVDPSGSSYIDGYNVTYTYKDVKGVLADALSRTRAVVNGYGSNGDFLFTVNSTSYLIREGEIIFSFVEGTERELPEAYHEYKNYKYVVNNVNSELYVQILDARYVCISEFHLPATVVNRLGASGAVDNSVYILGNGNLLIQGIYNVSDKDGDFDYYYNGDKFFTYNAIFNIETGEVTEIEPGFIIKGFYSAETENAPCLLTSELNVAEIAVFDKQTISEKTSLVVLDNKAAIVATLPTALPTQDTDVESIRFIDESRFIFTTTVKNESFVYHVDTTSKAITLVADDAVYMDGYFYTDRAIYSNSLEALYRFTDKDEIIEEVGNGLVIRCGREYKMFSLGAFGLANFATIAKVNENDSIYAIYDDLVVVSEGDLGTALYSVYNSKGEVLLSSDRAPVISYYGEGSYGIVTIDEITDDINGITKTYKKAYVLMCK